ncbi:hypothetical protein [Oceanobacter mangrovi]|uniref:hypothetical protein n=1 Tax=Oceanobacter mangrovi TaxID=2862510 RepID=UPI001C8D71B9|nr:hypothetical protein [Oceanobacter mangrovi]
MLPVWLLAVLSQSAVSQTTEDDFQQLQRLLANGTAIQHQPGLIALAAALQKQPQLSTQQQAWLQLVHLQQLLQQGSVAALSQSDEVLRQFPLTELPTAELQQHFVLARMQWLLLGLQLGLKPDLVAFVLIDATDQLAELRQPLSVAVAELLDACRFALASQLWQSGDGELAARLLKGIRLESPFWAAGQMLDFWYFDDQFNDGQMNNWLAHVEVAARPRSTPLGFTELESLRLAVALAQQAGFSNISRHLTLTALTDIHRHQQLLVEWQASVSYAGMFGVWQQLQQLPLATASRPVSAALFGCEGVMNCQPLLLDYVWDFLNQPDSRSAWQNLFAAQQLRLQLLQLRPVDGQLGDSDGVEAAQLRGDLAWLQDLSEQQLADSALDMKAALQRSLKEENQRLDRYADTLGGLLLANRQN